MAGIGTHLQRQRPHARGRDTRGRQRLDKRGYPDDGVPWGQKGWDPIVGSPSPTVPSTGATAGIPGIWTPAGSLRPSTVANLQGGIPNAVVASPLTGWTAGQFVQTLTAGAAGRACWTGSGWVGGVAPGILLLDLAGITNYVTSLDGNDEQVSITQALLDEERVDQMRPGVIAWLDFATRRRVTKCACGKPTEEGRDECFRCRVSSVGFNWRGGALLGKGGFHTTRAEYLKEHLRVDSEKELAKRPNVERAEA